MSTSLSPSLADLQARFVSIMPRIEVHGQISFRNERCPGKKDDCLAEMLAISWKWFVQLHNKGKDPTTFVSVIATYAARAVKSGRRLCGQEKTKDVLSPMAQRRRDFAVVPLPDHSTLNSNPLQEALLDNTQTPVPDQVSFRLDFPDWIRTHAQRDRRVIAELMAGEQTQEVARKHGVSSARISQMRHEYHADWLTFCGELPAATPSRTASAS
jgi:hypothetical protein